MKKEMRQEFNHMILAGDKSKKKGGGLSAVFNLIQNLTDFEEKIQDCVDAQDLRENKDKIEGFLTDIDQMYDVLLTMARGGISSIRSQRGQIDVIEDDDMSEESSEEASVVEEGDVAGDTRLISLDELKNMNHGSHNASSPLRTPQIPKM